MLLECDLSDGKVLVAGRGCFIYDMSYDPASGQLLVAYEFKFGIQLYDIQW